MSQEMLGKDDTYVPDKWNILDISYDEDEDDDSGERDLWDDLWESVEDNGGENW